MTTRTPDEDKDRIRDGLQRALECLRALDVAPEQFEAARHARSVRRREELDDSPFAAGSGG